MNVNERIRIEWRGRRIKRMRNTLGKATEEGEEGL